MARIEKSLPTHLAPTVPPPADDSPSSNNQLSNGVVQ